MRSSVALVFLSLVFGAAGVLSIAWGVVSLDRGEYLSVVVVAAAGVFSFGMVAMLTRLMTRNVTVRVHIDDSGTTFRPDRRVDVCLMAATVGLFVAMVLYAIFAPLDMAYLPVPRGDHKYLMATAIVGVVVGLPSIRQILLKRGMSYLRMSPDGFETGNAYSSVSRAWEEVTAVSDKPAPDRRPPNTGTTYITTEDGRTRTVPSDWYTPGGHALRDLVRFYWLHPESRDELIDRRAAQRLPRAT